LKVLKTGLEENGVDRCAGEPDRIRVAQAVRYPSNDRIMLKRRDCSKKD
jgi:hypothetical protein